MGWREGEDRQMRNIKLSIVTGAAIAAALLLAACGGSSTGTTSSVSNGTSASGSLAGQSITLYNGQHEQTTARLVSAFEKRTGVKVNVRTGDEAELGNQIIQEGSSSPADAFYTENTPVLEHLREEGPAGPRPSHHARGGTARATARRRASGSGSRRASRCSSTTPASSPPAGLPSSILALSEPRFQGKLGFAPSETDFQPLVSSITKLDGAAAAENWLQGIRANGKVYPDNETVVAQVNNGESAIGLINHYYWYRLRAEVGQGGMHSALHYYAPGDPGDLLNVSGAAVLKSSRTRRTAQAFVAFLVSREGQETIAHSDSYEYPLRPGVAARAVLRPFARARSRAPLTPARTGRRQRSRSELEQKLGLL